MKKESGLKEKPQSMFHHGSEMENEHEGMPKSETEHNEHIGDEHPEEDATGAPIHPKLQTLMGMLNEKDEPLAKGGLRGIKKKS